MAHSSDLAATLRLSQQVPAIIGRQSSWTDVLPLSTPVRESPEEPETIEQLFFACLQTGDDKSAQLCLDRLAQYFGASNERVTGLQGLYEEATAEGQADLEKCLEKYNGILSENPVNVPIIKRRIALLRSMSRLSDAVSALTELVGAIPTDAEAWCELADLYQSQGMSSQAIFCLEEVLLITPNAWNVYASLGELLYISASQETEAARKLLGRSVRLFCRSIELCDDYLRGLYGLALASSTLLKHSPSDGSSRNDATESSEGIPSKEFVERVHSFAKKKLGDLIKARSSESRDMGCFQSEIIATKELLNRFGESH
ncbi:hypothetical protein PHISP_02490 [Aspergillus sp. HF37]|nr:hypothetical protein PHISP_02490 [Aspergillus sp. HF37]